MLKKIIFLLFYFSTGHLLAQSYTKIPIDSNYFWKQTSCGFQYQLRYYKDTVVAGKIYNKYSVFGGTSGSSPCTQSFIKNGFLRQDTVAMKVFILDPSFVERPLYNFSKIAGDTLLMYDRVSNSNITYTVQIVVNGGQQELKDNAGYTQYIIPGMGSHEGGLYAACQFVPNNTDRLICFGKINAFHVISPPEVGLESQCNLMTPIRANIKHSFTSAIYPNPFEMFVTIQFSDGVDRLNKIEILNCLGEVMRGFPDVQINGSGSCKIDLSFLPAGLYFIGINYSGTSQVYKLVKQ